MNPLTADLLAILRRHPIVSPLQGEPAQDLPIVLAAIADWIEAQADG